MTFQGKVKVLRNALSEITSLYLFEIYILKMFSSLESYKVSCEIFLEFF